MAATDGVAAAAEAAAEAEAAAPATTSTVAIAPPWTTDPSVTLSGRKGMRSTPR